MDSIPAVGSPSVEIAQDALHSELTNLSIEDQEKLKEEWETELNKLEEDISTLREVLASKVRKSHELKKKLGHSVWKEFQDDMSQGIRNVKESQVYQLVEEKLSEVSQAVVSAPIYQKTESLVKATTERISNKLGRIKNSESFRSFEEKMGSAYENVKGRVTPSRSLSTQDFVQAMNDTEPRSKSQVTTPTIPEDKPL